MFHFRLAPFQAILHFLLATLTPFLAVQLAFLPLVVAYRRILFHLLGLNDVAQAGCLQARQHLGIEIDNVRGQDEHPLHGFPLRGAAAEEPADPRDVAQIGNPPPRLLFDVAEITRQHNGLVLEYRRLRLQHAGARHRHGIDSDRLETAVIQLQREPDLIGHVGRGTRHDARLDLELGSGGHLFQRGDLRSDHARMVALHIGQLRGEVVRGQQRRAGDRTRLALFAQGGQRGSDVDVFAQIGQRARQPLAGHIRHTEERVGVLSRAARKLAAFPRHLQRQLPVQRIFLGELHHRHADFDELLREVELRNQLLVHRHTGGDIANQDRVQAVLRTDDRTERGGHRLLDRRQHAVRPVRLGLARLSAVSA